MNFTEEEYDIIFKDDYHNGIGSFGAQALKIKDDVYEITIIVHSDFKVLRKTYNEIIFEAMKTEAGRDILIEKNILQDYYCGYDNSIVNKAMKIPTYNDGLSFLVDDLSSNDIENLEKHIFFNHSEEEKKKYAIKNYKVINLWT